MTSRGLLSVLLLAGLAGCISVRHPVYRITSAPSGGRIEVDGQPVGTTPATISLEVPVRGSYGRYAPWRNPFTITVYPPPGAGSTARRRTKRVVPNLKGGDLDFNLALPE
jgi:hypothetical protein